MSLASVLVRALAWQLTQENPRCASWSNLACGIHCVFTLAAATWGRALPREMVSAWHCLQVLRHNNSSASAVRIVVAQNRSEEHTSELQSRQYLVCRLLLDVPAAHVHALSLHDALPISGESPMRVVVEPRVRHPLCLYVGSGHLGKGTTA